MHTLEREQNRSSLLWELVCADSGRFTRCRPLDVRYELVPLSGDEENALDSAAESAEPPLSNAQLLELAEQSPPPDAWFQVEGEKPF